MTLRVPEYVLVLRVMAHVEKVWSWDFYRPMPHVLSFRQGLTNKGTREPERHTRVRERAVVERGERNFFPRA